MKDLEQKAVELLDKFEDLAVQYSPDVMNAALSAVQVSGIGNLIFGVACLIAAYLLYRLSIIIFHYCLQKKEEDDFYSDWGLGLVFSVTVSAIICVILVFNASNLLLDIWNYVAVFNPKLALAHKVLGL